MHISVFVHRTCQQSPNPPAPDYAPNQEQILLQPLIRQVLQRMKSEMVGRLSSHLHPRGELPQPHTCSCLRPAPPSSPGRDMRIDAGVVYLDSGSQLWNSPISIVLGSSWTSSSSPASRSIRSSLLLRRLQHRRCSCGKSRTLPRGWNWCLRPRIGGKQRSMHQERKIIWPVCTQETYITDPSTALVLKREGTQA